MKKWTRMLANIIEILLGLTLLITGILGLVDDYWSGMGSALLVVGVLQLLRQIRYRTDDAYRSAVDTEVNDERNKYLSMKAWSYAGYFFVILAAIATVVCKLLEQELLMTVASGSVCLLLVLYWLSYLYLRKKY